jgi:hypothetical protein
MKGTGGTSRKIVLGATGTVGTLLVVTFVVLFVILFRARRVLWKAKLPEEKVDPETFPWKSGDLLLCSRFGISNMMTQIISNSHWTHVGLVFVYDHRPYVWDIDIYNARLIPLLGFLEIYHGTVAVRSLSGTTPIHNAKFLRYIKTHWNSPYSFDFWLHGYNRIFTTLTLPLTPPIEEKSSSKTNFFCCTMTAATLLHLEVMTPPSHPLDINKLNLKDFESTSIPGQKGCIFQLNPGWKYEKELLLESPKK